MYTIKYVAESGLDNKTFMPNRFYVGKRSGNIFYVSKDDVLVRFHDGFTSPACDHNHDAFERVQGTLTIIQS